MGFYACIAIAAYLFGDTTLATFIRVVHDQKPMTPQEGSTIVGGLFVTGLFVLLAFLLKSEPDVRVTMGLIIGLGLFGFSMSIIKKR